MSYEGIDPSGQTVVYWHQYSDDSSQAETMAALVEEFNSSNEYGITVETIHQGSYSPIRRFDEHGNLCPANCRISLPDTPTLSPAGRTKASWSISILLLNSPEWGIPADEQANLNFNLLNVNQLDFPPFYGMRVAWANQKLAKCLLHQSRHCRSAGLRAARTRDPG